MARARNKIRTLRALKETHVLLFAHVRMLARLLWPWLVGLAVIFFVVSWFHFPDYVKHFETVHSSFFVYGSIRQFLLLSCGAVIAVTWHRFLLLDEMPIGFFSTTLAREYILYFLIGILIFLIMLLPLLLGWGAATYFDVNDSLGGDVTVVASQGEAQTSLDVVEDFELNDAFACLFCVGLLVLVLVVVFAPVACLLLFVPVRLSLALPAIAIGRTQTLLRSSWNMTKRNFLRLLWGLTLTAWPLFLYYGVYLTISSGMQANRLLFATGETLEILVDLATGIIGVIFLSIVYRDLEIESQASVNSR